VPAVLSIGIEGLPPATLGLLVAFAGFCVLGGQFGTNASAGMVYPTNCRARGLGLAFAVGRIGSVVGPILGASLIGLKLPIMALLAVMAVPMLAGAAAAFMLGLIARRRLASWRPEEMALPAHIA
jgi:AAHS family 4-hydroxybenzoate transporter-like MFS transporter